MSKVSKNAVATKSKKATSKSVKKTAPKVAFVNPHREGSAYWATVEGLRALGVDTLHPFTKIVGAIRQKMGSDYKAFAAKDAQSDNGKSADERIIQNVSVLKRADYGKPLRDSGYEIRFDGREKVAGLFKL